MVNHGCICLLRRAYAFAEHGVALLSSVLKSQRAVQVNVEIVRAFVRMRQMLAAHADLARKRDALEKRYDAQFKVVSDAVRALMEPPRGPSTVPDALSGYVSPFSTSVIDTNAPKGMIELCQLPSPRSDGMWRETSLG
jgi:hypothetical protein